MGVDDKIRNTVQDLKGKAKEGTGTATGDHELREEGRADQGKSDLKQAAEKAKDAFRH